MGRRFTAASSERIVISGSAALQGLRFTNGTWALLYYRSSDTGTFETFIATADNGVSAWQFHIGTTDLLSLYDNPNTRTFAGAIPVGVRLLVGITKSAGTTTARGHVYRFDTNVWTHVAASSTNTNTDPITPVVFGSLTAAGAEFLSGEVWAIGMWQALVMTDSEFERLAQGNWLNSAPTFYEQWTDGREVGDMMTTLGRAPAKQSSRTGTTRGVIGPPPGFRMCIQRRRR